MNDDDGRIEIEQANLGRIMSLVLDAADPNRSTDESSDLADEAFAINPEVAGRVAFGYFRTMLQGLAGQFGPESVAEVMKQLTAMSVGVFDEEI